MSFRRLLIRVGDVEYGFFFEWLRDELQSHRQRGSGGVFLLCFDRAVNPFGC